ncbi:MAG: DUF3500 domain-containing protein, partial [Planctomycetota bacterium]
MHADCSRRLAFASGLWFAATLSTAGTALGHADHDEPDVQKMRAAAGDLLAALPPDLRNQAAFEFDSPNRLDWHFIPKDRTGASLKEMPLPARRAAHRLLRSALSDRGYLKATTIMSLEQTLRLVESDQADVMERRDPEKYWFAIYGDPAGDGPWGWRVEGHHLSLNFSSVDGHVVEGFPAFFGANPAEIRIGPRLGLRALGDEEDLASDLIASLTEDQRMEARIAEVAPADIETAPGKPIDLGEPAGLAAADMTPEQRETLWELITLFAANLEDEAAEATLAEIEQAGMDQVYFGWAGEVSPDSRWYYRIHGPTFVVEFDKTTPNHIHMVWHSTENNFGLNALQRHYVESHAERPVVRLWPAGLPADAKPVDPNVAEKLASEETEERIGYVDDPTLTLYAAPADIANGCGVVVCPGGGYNILAWKKEGLELAEWFNSIGVTAAVLKYRVPRRDAERIHWEPLQDAQRAIRLMRQRADEWNVDPDRIGMLGFSAGGHLTMMAATHGDESTYDRVDEADDLSSRPDFCCPIYAAYLGDDYDDKSSGIGALVKIDANTPPTFLAVTLDDAYRGVQAGRLLGRFKDAGVAAEAHIYDEGGHGYGIRPSRRPASTWHFR